jgi:hypothetical protein
MSSDSTILTPKSSYGERGLGSDDFRGGRTAGVIDEAEGERTDGGKWLYVLPI